MGRVEGQVSAVDEGSEQVRLLTRIGLVRGNSDPENPFNWSNTRKVRSLRDRANRT